MSKTSATLKRIGGFFKRNAVYFLIILCLASVATVIALAVTRETALPNTDIPAGNVDDIPSDNPSNDNPNEPVVNPDTPSDPVDPTPVVKEQKFYTPCNDASVSNNYSDTVVVWNQTLKQYATHLALDFVSDDGNVYASCDGTVKEVGYNALDGYYICITHEDGYESRYLSLEEECSLKVGAKVEQGKLLGKMSTSQGSESLDGAHLHFELLKDGEYVNPLEVIVTSEK